MSFLYFFLQDDDTRNVMNAMSSPSLLTLDSLKFYIVPKSWFLKAWPLLTAKTHHNINNGWRESIGRIQNGELLNVEREVSSSEDENATADRQKKRFEQLHLRMQNNRQRVMKTGLEHTKDYFFIGPSAWLLVKEKFGYDGYELARSCSSSIVNGARTIAIQLLAEESDGSATSITIPPSGRFAYEKILQNDINDTSMLVPEERQANPSVVRIMSAVKSVSIFVLKLIPPFSSHRLLYLTIRTVKMEPTKMSNQFYYYPLQQLLPLVACTRLLMIWMLKAVRKVPTSQISMYPLLDESAWLLG